MLIFKCYSKGAEKSGFYTFILLPILDNSNGAAVLLALIKPLMEKLACFISLQNPEPASQEEQSSWERLFVVLKHLRRVLIWSELIWWEHVCIFPSFQTHSTAERARDNKSLACLPLHAASKPRQAQRTVQKDSVFSYPFAF